MSELTQTEANVGFEPPNEIDDLIETPEEMAERIARHKVRSDRVIPSVQCSYIRKDGSRCKAWALRGATVCIAHGARLPRVKAAAERRIEEARVKLGLNASHAVDVIVDQMTDPDTPAYVRQKAAFGLLDRAGIGPGHKTEVEVNGTVTHEHTVEAGGTVTAHLERLAEHTPAYMLAPADDITDAEIVDGTDD